jgi:hypothetical protein
VQPSGSRLIALPRNSLPKIVYADAAHRQVFPLRKLRLAKDVDVFQRYFVRFKLIFFIALSLKLTVLSVKWDSRRFVVSSAATPAFLP